MMIVMKAGATEDQVQAVIDRIESCGAHAHPSRGEEVTVIGAVGDREHVARLGLEGGRGAVADHDQLGGVGRDGERPLAIGLAHGGASYCEG